MIKSVLKLLFLCLLSFSLNAQTVEDDFEGNGTITNWYGDDCNIDISYPNPFQESLNNSNTVLRYNDVGGPYANVRFDVLANFDLSVNRTFSFKIFVPSESITGNRPNEVALKLQNRF